MGHKSPPDDADGRSLRDEIAREGRAEWLWRRWKTEVVAYLEAHRDERDDAGHALVLRNGTARPREVTLGPARSP